MSERARALRRLIAEEIRARGPVPFERFMERALYEPGLGYYSAGGEARGPGIDFRTSPQVHPIFARLLASQVEECWRLLGAPEGFVVVEFGSGSMDLARGVMEALAREGAWPRGARYLAVDLPRPSAAVGGDARGGALPEGAAARGSGGPAPEPAGEAEALRAVGAPAAVVLSNEFVDALPVRRLVMRGGAPREVRVGLDPRAPAGGDPAFVEVEAEVVEPELAGALRSLPDLPDGFHFEIHPRARAWIEAVGRALERGYVLTLDYGYRRGERFRPERADGTVAAYHRNRAVRDLCARAGEQDLTCHVDFDELIEAGRGAGLALLGLTEQMRFLTALAAPLGLLEGEPSGAAAWRERLAFKELIRPGGMGTAFRVLAQGKGVPAAPLRGLGDPFAR